MYIHVSETEYNKQFKVTKSSTMSSVCDDKDNPIPMKSWKFVLNLLKSCLVEFIGSAILVGVLTMLTNKPFEVQVMAAAGTLALIIWIFAASSEAHFNPVVSICFTITRRLSIIRLVCFLLSQLLGSLAGNYFTVLLVNENVGNMRGMTHLVSSITSGQGLTMEILATFLLVITIMSSADEFRSNSRPIYDLALFTGCSFGICIACIGLYTGCSLNPARSLGPAIVHGYYKDQWVYVVGPVIGGILAAFLYEMCLCNAVSLRRTKVMFSSRNFDRNHLY